MQQLRTNSNTATAKTKMVHTVLPSEVEREVELNVDVEALRLDGKIGATEGAGKETAETSHDETEAEDHEYDILPSMVKVIEKPQMSEINPGVWDGLTLEEVRERYPEEWDLFVNDPYSFRARRAESYHDLSGACTRCAHYHC